MRHTFLPMVKGACCALFASSLFLSSSFAATRTADATGSWLDPNTWDCNCLPAVGDVINIPTGFTVNIPDNFTIDLSASGITVVNITGGSLAFSTNTSKLFLSITSVINLFSGSIDPPNNGSTIFIEIGTCTPSGGTGLCRYTGGELDNLVPPVQLSNSGSSALPVEWKSFQATERNKTVFLEWETGSELDNQGFEIQRSFNGVDFRAISWVEGNGTNTDGRTYSYTDLQPQRGFNYYRLAQRDFDGKVSFSSVEVVNLDGSIKDPLAWFNPRENGLRILLPEASESGGLALVFDLHGKLIARQYFSEGDSEVRLDMSSLPEGRYLAKMNG